MFCGGHVAYPPADKASTYFIQLKKVPRKKVLDAAILFPCRYRPCGWFWARANWRQSSRTVIEFAVPAFSTHFDILGIGNSCHFAKSFGTLKLMKFAVIHCAVEAWYLNGTCRSWLGSRRRMLQQGYLNSKAFYYIKRPQDSMRHGYL